MYRREDPNRNGPQSEFPRRWGFLAPIEAMRLGLLGAGEVSLVKKNEKKARKKSSSFPTEFT
jgi:hypothetical protein